MRVVAGVGAELESRYRRCASRPGVDDALRALLLLAAAPAATPVKVTAMSDAEGLSPSLPLHGPVALRDHGIVYSHCGCAGRSAGPPGLRDHRGRRVRRGRCPPAAAGARLRRHRGPVAAVESELRARSPRSPWPTCRRHALLGTFRRWPGPSPESVLITKPSRMSDSEWTMASRPRWRMIATNVQQPPTITSARASSSPGLAIRSARLGGERAEDVLGGVAGEDEVVEAVAVVGGQADLDGDDVSRPCRPADHGGRVPGRRGCRGRRRRATPPCRRSRPGAPRAAAGRAR